MSSSTILSQAGKADRTAFRTPCSERQCLLAKGTCRTGLPTAVKGSPFWQKGSDRLHHCMQGSFDCQAGAGAEPLRQTSRHTTRNRTAFPIDYPCQPHAAQRKCMHNRSVLVQRQQCGWNLEHMQCAWTTPGQRRIMASSVQTRHSMHETVPLTSVPQGGTVTTGFPRMQQLEMHRMVTHLPGLVNSPAGRVNLHRAYVTPCAGSRLLQPCCVTTVLFQCAKEGKQAIEDHLAPLYS